MIFVNKLKTFFLIVIIVAFCYRAALLEQQLSAEEITRQESVDQAFYAFLMMFCENTSLNATATSGYIEKNHQASAASKEHFANKLNTLIEGYAEAIARQLEKSSPDKKMWTKIERELVIIEQAARDNDAQNLLKNDVIQEIKKSIARLRMTVRAK